MNVSQTFSAKSIVCLFVNHCDCPPASFWFFLFILSSLSLSLSLSVVCLSLCLYQSIYLSIFLTFSIFFLFFSMYIYIYTYRKRSLCRGYRCKKWIMQFDFKTRKRPLTFHKTRIEKKRCMNPTILPLGIGKYYGKLNSLTFVCFIYHPMNINCYVPFLINTLDTIVRWVKYAISVVTTSSHHLHAAGEYFILLMLKRFPFHFQSPFWLFLIQ